MLSSVVLILGLCTVVSTKSTIDDVGRLFRNTIEKWGVEIQDDTDYEERYKRLVEAKERVDLTSSGVELDSLNRFSVNNDDEETALLQMTERRPANRAMDVMSGQENIVKRGLAKRSDDESEEFDYWENELGLPEVQEEDLGDSRCLMSWAFAPTITLAALYKQLTGDGVEFSAQYFVDCTFDTTGCGTGIIRDVLNSTKYNQFMMAEEDYPYGYTYQGCNAARTEDNNAMKLTWVTYYTRLTNSEEAFLEAVKTSPVSFQSYVGTKNYQAYSGGLFSDSTCTTDLSTIEQLLVGYTQTYMRVRSITYGSSWGDGGYINYKRDDSNSISCGMFKTAFTASMVIKRDIEYAFCNGGVLATRETCKASCSDMNTAGSNGWHLAVIPTVSHNDEVVEMVNAEYPIKSTNLQDKFKLIWIGLVDPDKAWEYSWENDYSTYDVQYMNMETYSKTGKFGLLDREEGTWTMKNSWTFKARGVCSRIRTCYDFTTQLKGHGTVSYSVEGDLVEATTATVTCDDGYEIQGSAQVTCQAGGQWDGDDSNLPNCV